MLVRVYKEDNKCFKFMEKIISTNSMSFHKLFKKKKYQFMAIVVKEKRNLLMRQDYAT